MVRSFDFVRTRAARIRVEDDGLAIALRRVLFLANCFVEREAQQEMRGLQRVVAEGTSAWYARHWAVGEVVQTECQSELEW